MFQTFFKMPSNGPKIWSAARKLWIYCIEAMMVPYPSTSEKKVIFRNYWNKHETAFSTIARNHRTRNISIQTILSDSNLYLSQHLLIQVRHLAPSSDYPLFKIIIITRKTSPSATMRGLPAAHPRRSLRSPTTPTLAPLALSQPT